MDPGERTGTIADPGSPTSAISGLGVGNNVFRWTITNGPCANPVTFDQVTIQVFDQNVPTANAGPDQDCALHHQYDHGGKHHRLPRVRAHGPLSVARATSRTLLADHGHQQPGRRSERVPMDGPATALCSGSARTRSAYPVFSNSVPSANAGPDQSLHAGHQHYHGGKCHHLPGHGHLDTGLRYRHHRIPERSGDPSITGLGVRGERIHLDRGQTDPVELRPAIG